MTLHITQDRLEEILHLLDAWTHKVMADKIEVLSLVGKLVFVASCVKPGRIFISRMLNFLRVMRVFQRRNLVAQIHAHF